MGNGFRDNNTPPDQASVIWERVIWPASVGVALVVIVIVMLFRLTRPIDETDSPAVRHGAPDKIVASIDLVAVVKDYLSKQNQLEIKKAMTPELLITARGNAEAKTKFNRALRNTEEFRRRVRKLSDEWKEAKYGSGRDRPSPVFDNLLAIIREEREVLEEHGSFIDYIGSLHGKVTLSGTDYHFTHNKDLVEYSNRRARLMHMMQKMDDNQVILIEKMFAGF